MHLQEINESVAVFLLRSVTGILFFFQGYDKLFKVKVINVVRTFDEPLHKSGISSSLARPFIAFSSMVEMICGLLLILGLFRTIDLYLLAGNMIIVALVFSSMKAMWDMQFYFPRLILIAILIFTLNMPDTFSLDAILF